MSDTFDGPLGLPALHHLLGGLPAVADAGTSEQFDTLLERPGLRIERIVSTGQSSPEGFWYDQHEHEWVLVLQGSAGLAFDDKPDDVITLRPGDCLQIDAHRRHRVAWTATGEVTVWLAIHFA